MFGNDRKGMCQERFSDRPLHFLLQYSWNVWDSGGEYLFNEIVDVAGGTGSFFLPDAFCSDGNILIRGITDDGLDRFEVGIVDWSNSVISYIRSEGIPHLPVNTKSSRGRRFLLAGSPSTISSGVSEGSPR